MSGNNPAIVVVAHKRIKSLKRLLESLSMIHNPGNLNIPLIFSIDKSVIQQDILKTCEDFTWLFGEKKIILRDDHFGLKNHIISCGELVNQYGSLIILEDDLFLSPFFYEYSCQAIQYYQDEKNIAGISLYSYRLSENQFFPFTPVEDGSDVYFIQVPSSWGQVFTANMWNDFKTWFNDHPNIPESPLLIPEYVLKWGTHSWKKHFIHYLIENNKYFVFPRKSFTTNFEDPGTNSSGSLRFQVPIIQSYSDDMHFIKLSDSGSLYDSWFELLPSCINKLFPELSAFNYQVDLHGTKPYNNEWDYYLTQRNVRDPLFSFSNRLIPVEENLRYQLTGSKIYFAKSKNVDFNENAKISTCKVDIILPLLDFNKEKITKTLHSLELTEVDQIAKIIFVIPQQFEFDFLHWVETVFSDDTFIIDYVVSSGHSNNPYQLFYEGLRKVGADFFCWIKPGFTFQKNQIHASSLIFYDFKKINWIVFAEERNLHQFRINAALYKSKILNSKKSFSTQVMFFRNGLQDTFDKENEALSILNLLQLDKLYPVVSNKSIPIVYENVTQLNNIKKINISVSKESQFFLFNLFDFVFRYWMIQNVIYLRSIYVLKHNLSDLLKYDVKNKCYYLDRY